MTVSALVLRHNLKVQDLALRARGEVIQLVRRRPLRCGGRTWLRVPHMCQQ